MVTSLREFASENSIQMTEQRIIAEEAKEIVKRKYNLTSPEEIKEHFDDLVAETESAGHEAYFRYEKEYGAKVLDLFMEYLKKKGELKGTGDLRKVFLNHFRLLDRFFLSLAQSRKSRAGKSFEEFHNTLFKELNYPFEEQVVINGKPDFLMPSGDHYRANAMDCIIFTAKRTLRERWRQIVTEGTRGLGFFLATIDTGVSQNQIDEMRQHRIYLVVPAGVKETVPHYKTAVNVLSFRQFFQDHLDPRVEVWKRNGVI